MSLALALTALVSTAGVASAQVPPEIDAPETADVGEAFDVDVFVYVTCALPVPVKLSVGEQVLGTDEISGPGTSTFSVTIDVLGPVVLRADVVCDRVPSSATHSMTIGIPPGQPVAPCPSGVTCEQTWNGDNIAATLVARSGNFIDPKFVNNSALSCNGGHPEPNSVLSFDHDGNVPKKAKFALDRSIIKKPLWRYRVCWYSDMKFVPRGGGQPVNKGLLRNCRRGVDAPCVLNKRWVRGGALIVVLVPAGDPKGYFR